VSAPPLMPDGRPLRVAHLLVGAEVGGAEEFFLNLACAFAARGIAQHAFVSPFPARERALTEAGAGVTTLEFNAYLGDFFSRRRMARIARGFAPHVFLSWMNRAGRRTPRGPWVSVGRLGGYYPTKYYRRCDHLIGNTPGVVEFIKGDRWPADRVSLVGNFAALPPAPPVDRTELGAQAEDIVALALCRLHPSKGLDDLLRALAAGPPSLKLWIAGAGPARAELEALAAELGLAGRVRFLGWRTDRAALLEACDLVVHPARLEPLGNVVLEAWAAGRPVLAAASEGPAWLIEDGVSGRLAPPADPEALGAALRALADDPAARARLVEGGRAASTRFSEDAVVGACIDLFHRLWSEKT